MGITRPRPDGGVKMEKMALIRVIPKNGVLRL